MIPQPASHGSAGTGDHRDVGGEAPEVIGVAAEHDGAAERGDGGDDERVDGVARVELQPPGLLLTILVDGCWRWPRSGRETSWNASGC